MMASVGATHGIRADVLLLGGESRVALAAARSFAAKGVPFVAVSAGRPGLLAASRSVRHHVVGPNAAQEPEAYIEFVLETARSTGARLAIPTHDDALRAGALFRDALTEDGVTFAAAPTAALENVLDKRANLATAVRLGIPLPAQFELESIDDVPALIDALGFPLVLKRGHAGPPGVRQSFRPKWLVARDERELRDALATHCSDGVFPIFQERLQGQVVGLYCFAVRGRVVAVHQSVAERRSVGENVLRRIVPLDPTLEGHARALLGELAWDGPAALAFFVAPDGKIAYMETNGRFWGSLEGSIRAGWDYPAWTVDYFRDGVIPSPPPIALGSRGCWRVGDMIGLANVLAGAAWVTDREDVGKLRAVREYLASFRPGIHADVFRIDDPVPEIVEHWRWLRPAIGRALRRPVRLLRR